MVPEPPVPEPEPPRGMDRSIVARAGIALALFAVLAVSLHWALNVTTANARQVSSNLTSMQDHIEQSGAFPESAPNVRVGKPRQAHSNDGPTLEPVDER